MATSVRLQKFSRLRFGNLIEIDGVAFWDLLELPDILEQPDDVFHQVTGTDRIDSLAMLYYGSPVLWWIIAAANDLELLPVDLQTGDILRIPSKRYVQQVLFGKVVQ